MSSLTLYSLVLETLSDPSDEVAMLKSSIPPLALAKLEL